MSKHRDDEVPVDADSREPVDETDIRWWSGRVVRTVQHPRHRRAAG